MMYWEISSIALWHSDLLPEHVWTCLPCPPQNKPFVKAEKCEFHGSSVSSLGYIIESRQVKADPDQIRAVAEWPRPSSQKWLQRFLGFANFYRCFIRDYSKVAAPHQQTHFFRHSVLLDSWGWTCLFQVKEPRHLRSHSGPTRSLTPVHHWSGCIWHWSRGSPVPTLMSWP